MIKRLPLIILISAAILLSSNITFASERLAPATVSRGPRFLVQLGHSSTVTSIAISPDGRAALSGSNDKTLKLWEIFTGREIRRFSGHLNHLEV